MTKKLFGLLKLFEQLWCRQGCICRGTEVYPWMKWLTPSKVGRVYPPMKLLITPHEVPKQPLGVGRSNHVLWLSWHLDHQVLDGTSGSKLSQSPSVHCNSLNVTRSHLSILLCFESRSFWKVDLHDFLGRPLFIHLPPSCTHVHLADLSCGSRMMTSTYHVSWLLTTIRNKYDNFAALHALKVSWTQKSALAGQACQPYLTYAVG